MSGSRDLSLAALAEITGARLEGEPDRVICGVGSLEDADASQLAFLASSRFRQHLGMTHAGVVILTEKDAADCPADKLITDNPYLAYARAATALTQPDPLPGGVHPSAVVDPSAEIAPGARIESLCTIGAGARIGEGVQIGPNCVVAEGCHIGRDTRLVASVTLGRNTVLGERCLVQPGAVIGGDGFGMANEAGRWVRVPQLGRVVLGNDVEVGACTTIDRGAIKDTRIADGVKLDNLIQIGHNVEVGEHTAMASGVGVSGSTRIGAYCTLAGAVGVAGHLELSDRVHVSAMTGVAGSIREPGVYTGVPPMMPHKQWRKNYARLRQLDDMARRLKALEKALAERDSDQQDQGH